MGHLRTHAALVSVARMAGNTQPACALFRKRNQRHEAPPQLAIGVAHRRCYTQDASLFDGSLPFAPGQSPFRTKGLTYRAHLAYIEAHVPGGSAAVNANFSEQSVGAFFEQPFTAGGWYDVFPLVAAGGVCARLLALPLDTFLRRRAQQQVEQDFGGIYQYIAKMVSGGLLLKGISAGLGRYFDFVTAASEKFPDGSIQITIHGVPECMADWFRIANSAYIESALAASGHPGCRINSTLQATEARSHGLPSSDVVLRLRWR